MFKCEQCPSTFEHKRSLATHQKYHDRIRFQCSICSLTFNYKSYYLRHMKRLHEAIECSQPLLQRREIEVPSNMTSIVINIDDDDEPMALKMTENHKQNETGAANLLAASPTHSHIHEEIESLDSASITTNINKNNNQEILPKDCVYAESIKGKFSWKLIEGYHIPYIIRVINGEYLEFVSVRMAETQLLRKYNMQYLHPDIYTCTSIKGHFISDPEAKLLNDINRKHNDCLYGSEMFVAGKDVIAGLEDVHQFYIFLDVCHKKLLCNVPGGPGDNNKCGFIICNSKYVVPYCTHDGQKYLPTFYFEGEIEGLISRALKLGSWNLAYLKFCLKVQGTINELFDSDSCAMVNIDHIKNSVTSDTNFEEYWPVTVDNLKFLTNQKSNNVNLPGAWIRAPGEVVSAENNIPRSLIEPPSSTPQSIEVTKNTYLNGGPANQMSSTMSQGSILINGTGHVVQPTPLVHTAVDTNTASAPAIGNTVSSSNVVHSYQDNMTIVNPMTYNYIKSHQSQTRPIYTQRNNNIQFQQQQLQQQIITTLQPQQSYYIQQHNALRDVRKIVIPPASQTIDFSYPLSSPVPPTFQENTLYRNDGYELTRIPEYRFARDGSDDSAYKIQKDTLQGRAIQCINAKPFIYSDLMVTLNDLVKIALPRCTIRQCACILTKHFKITLYGGNSEQLALLRSNGRPWLLNAESTPLVRLESINRVLPQLQTFLNKNDEEIQQSQPGIFKR